MKQPKPLGVLVMVKLDDMEGKTKGGLYMPNITKETQFLVTGTVLDKGPGFYDQGILRPIDLEPGDRILFQISSANRWKESASDVDEYVFVQYGNVLAKIPPKAT